MFETVKLNILIPLKYRSENVCKDKCNVQNYVAAEYENTEDIYKFSVEWFKKCFRNKKIESNYQNANSALLIDDNYKISRVELNSDIRNSIGLYQNENTLYGLCGSDIKFTIGKIRILFTKSQIAFLHLQLISEDLDENSSRRFIYSFSKINSGQPLITYQKKLSINEVKEVKKSFKEIIMNIINIQSYIPVSLYENIIAPYFQICIIGTCDNENKLNFFDSVQALSNRQSSRELEERKRYIGKEEYVSRFVGDRCICIFGDTEKCGQSNLQFITDKKNGLVKSATENYTTVYAFLISLYLLVMKVDLSIQSVNYLLNAPCRLSDEENIRDFFDNCIMQNGWKLTEKINLIKEKLQINQNTDIHKEILELKRTHEKNTNKVIWEEKKNSYQVMELHTEVKNISGQIEKLDSKVSFLVDFIKNELADYLKEQKERFVKSIDARKDACVGEFIKNTSSYIDDKIMLTGAEIVNRERDGLAILFGNRWEYLLPTSQTSLVSASAMLTRCSDIRDIDFDFSGICICATAALEAELKRIFFDGLINYMIVKYDEPNEENGDKIYENWPDILLSIPKHKYEKGNNDDIKIKTVFTMGNLPYLFGNIMFSNKRYIKSKQLEQSALARKCMSEYLSTIVYDKYKENPIDCFYASENNDEGIFCKEDCFVYKCEKVRKDYRNKAAHINVMTEEQAMDCYQSVVSKPDTYKYNAEVVGVLMELFDKVDGAKLNSVLQKKYIGESTKNYVKVASKMYSVGQVVDMTNIEITFNGGLRGIINGSDIGVSLSKNHIMKKGLIAKDCIGKVMKVKLIRWDANAGKFNAEWIGVE